MIKVARYSRSRGRTGVLFESFDRTKIIREIEEFELDPEKNIALIQFLAILKEDEKK